MEEIIKFLGSPSIEGFYRLLVMAAIVYAMYGIRLILRRILLLEYKHIAANEAIGRALGNGYMKHYTDKLKELTEEFKFTRSKDK